MTLDPDQIGLDRDILRANRGWMTALGILWILLGIAAIVLPFAATLAVELVLGAIFIVGGVAQIIQAFRARGWRGALLHGLGGLLAVVLGVLLLLFPAEGILTVTLVLAAFFIVDGVLRVISAFQHRGMAAWGWILVSGLLGIAVGALIWLGWPSTAAWALGLLVGIQLIFGGWSLVMLATAAGRA